MATSSDTVVLLLAPALTCSSSSSSWDGLGQGAPVGACIVQRYDGLASGCTGAGLAAVSCPRGQGAPAGTDHRQFMAQLTAT